jgi:hypothetical protein
MVYALGSFPRCYRVVKVFKIAQMMPFSTSFYVRHPSLVSAVPRHAEMARRAAGVSSPVLVILRVRDIPQVSDAVVRLLVVDVVNDAGGPHPVNVKPRQPVRFVHFAVDTYGRVAYALFYAPGVCFAARPPVFSTNPLKHSGLWVVVQ